MLRAEFKCAACSIASFALPEPDREPVLLTLSGDFLRLLYILSHRQAEKFFASLGILDPSPAAFKQRRGTYFHYNRSAIGLACAQAIAMRIDIARHKRPIKPARRAPAPYLLHLPMHAQHA